VIIYNEIRNSIDYLIIGAGIIGLSIACELNTRISLKKIAILGK